MKAISELVENRAWSSESPQPATNGKRASTFWKRMTELYGHKWTSAQGEAPNPTWSRAISALSDDELKLALRTCLTSGDAWPPSLPEFLAMCRAPKRENAAAYRFQALPSAQKSSSERAASELANLRRMLGGG